MINWRATRANVQNLINPLVAYQELGQYYDRDKGTIQKWLKVSDKPMNLEFLQDMADLLDMDIVNLYIDTDNHSGDIPVHNKLQRKSIATVEELGNRIELNRKRRQGRDALKSSVTSSMNMVHAAIKEDFDLAARIRMLEWLFALSLKSNVVITNAITIDSYNSYTEFAVAMDRLVAELIPDTRAYVFARASQMCGQWPEENKLPPGDDYWQLWNMQRMAEQDYEYDRKVAEWAEQAWESMDLEYKEDLELSCDSIDEEERERILQERRFESIID